MVEAHISIVTVPIKGDAFKMVKVLRALTLLEVKAKQVSAWQSGYKCAYLQMQTKVSAAPPQLSATLKRKAGHGEERENVKRVNMDVDK